MLTELEQAAVLNKVQRIVTMDRTLQTKVRNFTANKKTVNETLKRNLEDLHKLLKEFR